MENKKIELGVFAAENRKRAADFLNKTTNKVKTALDQNDDGELNLKDASIIAETLNASVKGTVAVIKDIAQTKNRELELKTLQPIFAENLDGAGFLAAKACPHYRDGQKTCRKRSLQRFCGLFLERKRFEGRQYFPR